MRGQTKSEVKGGVVHQADGHHSTYIHVRKWRPLLLLWPVYKSAD